MLALHALSAAPSELSCVQERALDARHLEVSRGGQGGGHTLSLAIGS